MRDRIVAAVITAIVHNKRSTIAGLVAVLGLVVAKLGLDVSDDVLLKVAGFLVLVITAAAGDSHQRGARKVLPLLLLGLVLTQTACPKVQTVRSIASATAVGCAEVKATIAPDLTAEEKAVVFPIVDEVALAADGVRVLSQDWDRMGPAEKRHLAAFAAEQIGAAVERLSAQNIGFKSERARAKVADFQKWGRRAVSALRIIEASVQTETPRQ